jgi:hypothetical protein
MITMVLPLRHERELDWDAAAHAIRGVRLAALWGAGELYPLEASDFLPGAVPAFIALREAQAELHAYACELRGAIEHGWPEELIVLDTATHRIWVTGGPDWGEPAGDLIDPAIYLAEAGITDAAGFEDHTRYIDTPHEQRALDFEITELRLTRFGVAAAHAAEQAAGMDHPGPGASAREWLAAWLAELEPADASRGGRALLRFIARGLALSAWLKDPRSPITRERLDGRARALAQVADEGGLETRPREQSWLAAGRLARLLVDDIADWFDVLDEPERFRDDEGAHAFIANAGGTLGDALEIEVMAHALFAANAALADLGGDDVGDVVDVAPTSIVSQHPCRSQRRVARLDQYLALIVLHTIDWLAGERAIDALDRAARDERRADLVELKHLVTVSEYRRFATSQRLDAGRLFIVAPHFGDAPDVAVSIARLARDGILDAAGVRDWSAPDPDFNGPVETFVGGYGLPRHV